MATHRATTGTATHKSGTRKSKTPGTMKDVLSANVRHQQKRSNAVASPPEAQRSPHQRIKDADRKRKTH